MARSVEKVYGEALFEAAEESGKLTEIMKEAEDFSALLSENADLKGFLNFPRLSSDEKMKKMEEIFAGQLSDEMMGLLNIVLEKKREASLEGILRYFTAQAHEKLGIGTVSVTIPAAVTEEQKKNIEDKLLATTAFTSLEVTYTVDPSLIGGMIIRVGDKVVDSSIRTRLESIERDLKKIQLS